jgi:hypothetical protein
MVLGKLLSYVPPYALIAALYFSKEEPAQFFGNGVATVMSRQ